MIFNYRYRLFALDRTTGRKVPGWGNDSGWVDLREGLGRPAKEISVSASTPGVVFEDLLIMGSTVPEQFAERSRRHPRVRPEDRLRCGGAFTRSRIPVSRGTRRGLPMRGRWPAARTRGPV